MLRLVVTYSLVLSLLAGPTLCCCTAARLGHVPNASRSPAPTANRSCCGHGQNHKSSGADLRDAGGEKPGSPAKCPCKGDPGQPTAVPEASGATADLPGLFAAVVPWLDRMTPVGGAASAVRSTATFDLRSSSVSTADLLFAHHNLRC